MFPHIQKQIDAQYSLGLVPFVSINSCEGQTVSGTVIDPYSGAIPETNRLSYVPKLTVDNETGYMFDAVTEVYYTLDRAYIGTRPVVTFLKALGIVPELSNVNHTVCSIGYSNKYCQWFAWCLHGVQVFVDKQSACDWIKTQTTINVDRYVSLDRLFASAVVTSPAFLRIVESYGKESIQFSDLNVNMPSFEEAEAIELFNNSPANNDSLFNDMFESLYKERVKPSDLVHVHNNSRMPDFGRVSGEHRQHKSGILNGSTRRQSGDHYQHNVPTDGQVSDPYSGIKVGVKKSGEHIQHGHPNPPTFLPSQSSDLVSESAEDPSKYEWYRYAPSNGRSINLKGFNKEFPQASIDDGEVFGLRAIRGKPEYYLTFANADDFGILFRVPESLATRAERSSKPFKGKVPMGRASKVEEAPKEKVTKIVPKTEKQLTPKERRELEKQRAIEEAKNKRLAPQVRNSVIQPDGKINLRDIDEMEVKSRDVTYVGLFQQSMFTDDYHVFIDDERDDVYDEIMDAINRGKNSNPIAYILKVRATQDWVAPYIGLPANKMRMASAIVKRIIATNKHETITGIRNVTDFSERPAQPNGSKFKRSEPLYYGNSFEILLEVKTAILAGYFTKAFKVTDIKNRNAITFSDEQAKADPNFGIESAGDEDFLLVLSSQNTNPLYRHEAEEIGDRLARVYGPALKTVIKEGKTSSGDSMLFVVIRLALKKTSDEQLHRSRMLHDLVRNELSNKEQVQKNSDFSVKLAKLRADLQDAFKRNEQEERQEQSRLLKKIGLIQAEIQKLDIENVSEVDVKKIERYNSKREQLLQDIETAKELDEKRKAELKDIHDEQISKQSKAIREFAKQHRSEFKDQLVFNIPVYKAKFGNTFVSVEAVDYNIPDGTIGVRVIRGGDRTVHQVKSLYTFDDETLIFP